MRTQSIWIRRTMLQLLLLSLLPLAGCGHLAVMFTPEKKPSPSQIPSAVAANEYFWKALHAGSYDDIPQTLTALTAAYLENPNDAVTAAHADDQFEVQLHGLPSKIMR